MTKQEIRSHIKGLKEKLTQEEIESCSQKMAEVFLKSEEYQKCSSLFCYVSFNQEVRTLSIINKAIADGKKVAVPKVLGEVIRFFEINSLEVLKCSNLGILEPQKQCEMLPEAGMENLILVPGLAFDTKGNRIGYGKGYYDRYFAKHSKAKFLKIALAYDFQVMEHVPYEESDYPVNRIITSYREIETA